MSSKSDDTFHSAGSHELDEQETVNESDQVKTFDKSTVLNNQLPPELPPELPPDPISEQPVAEGGTGSEQPPVFDQPIDETIQGNNAHYAASCCLNCCLSSLLIFHLICLGLSLAFVFTLIPSWSKCDLSFREWNIVGAICQLSWTIVVGHTLLIKKFSSLRIRQTWLILTKMIVIVINVLFGFILGIWGAALIGQENDCLDLNHADYRAIMITLLVFYWIVNLIMLCFTCCFCCLFCSYWLDRDENSTPSSRKMIRDNTAVSILKDLTGLTDNNCEICLVDYETGDEIRYLACQHYFHTECIDRWLKTKSQCCPICRQNITCANNLFQPDDVNRSTNNEGTATNQTQEVVPPV